MQTETSTNDDQENKLISCLEKKTVATTKNQLQPTNFTEREQKSRQSFDSRHIPS